MQSVKPRIEPPFLRLPSRELRFRQEAPLVQKEQPAFSHAPQKKPMVLSDFPLIKLSEESATRLIEHIQTRNQTHPRKKPPPSSSVSSVSDFVTSLTEHFNIVTQKDRDRITLAYLIEKRVTLNHILKNCRISVTDLISAHIVLSFDDLLALKFLPVDLTYDRKLFNVQTLTMFFHTYFEDLRATRNSFGVNDLLRCKFTLEELETLRFSIGTLIESGELTRSKLWEFNFELGELRRLQFEKKHLDILQISRATALKNRLSGGFEWPIDEYDALVDDL